MSVDLDTLTALAKAATPGTRTVDCVKKAAEFIAACSPDVILALASRLRELEAIVVELPEGAMVTLQKWYTEKERAKKLEEVLRSAKVVVDGVADWFSDNPQLPKRIDDMLTPSEPT